jgi:hypothetical protein
MSFRVVKMDNAPFPPITLIEHMVDQGCATRYDYYFSGRELHECMDPRSIDTGDSWRYHSPIPDLTHIRSLSPERMALMLSDALELLPE